MTLLARNLDPGAFGLVAMVTAVSGALCLFLDLGLSVAAIQKQTLSQQESSTIFWINTGIGTSLSALLGASAPVLAHFYRQPQLFAVTIALAPTLLLTSLGAQHSVLLQRQMRFKAIALIEIFSLSLSSAIAIIMAKTGCGYWALVVMAISQPLSSSTCLWFGSRWIPARPRRIDSLSGMFRFGGTVTLNCIVFYIGSNLDKVLLGRFWGASPIGLYTRAYQLTKIPIDSVHAAFGQVAFAAISRVQDDPPRLNRYWVSGYSLILSFSVPVCFAAALFARDIIPPLLGPHWAEAVKLIELLSGGILAQAIYNPLTWLLDAMGHADKALKMSLGAAPAMIAGSLAGMPYGPEGVALGYSGALLASVLPVIAWSVKGSPISFWAVLRTLARPLTSAGVAAAAVLLIRALCDLPTVLEAITEIAVFSVTYSAALLFVFGQRSLYLDLCNPIRKPIAT
jgi:O-antigen/teichoic acid export membrane protein